MNLKKLTQAGFDGLPPEYRWAAVDGSGEAHLYNRAPELSVARDVFGYFTNHTKECDYLDLGEGYDATDWQNSLIERRDVPTAAGIDWSAAPEGATHWHKDEFVRWTGKRNPVFGSWDMDAWLGGAWALAHWGWQGTLETFLEDGAIPRPESITDVARSIEAARVAEQSERTYPHYFKDVSDVDAIDLYHVARLYDITDPALFHAFKKIACAGKRGAKDQAQDVQEAIDALKRWQELSV